MWPWSKVKELESEIAQLKKVNDALSVEKVFAESERDEAQFTVEQQQARIAALEDKVEAPNANEPWFKMWTDGFHAELGIQLRMDWNDAMIAHLKQSGVDKGPEEMRIQKWLSFTLAGIIQDLDAKAIEMLSRQTESEFK